MSRPDRPSRQRSNCRRKRAFFSEEEARVDAQEVKDAGKLRGEDFVVYLCPVCHHYHWGNVKSLK